MRAYSLEKGVVVTAFRLGYADPVTARSSRTEPQIEIR